MTSAQKESDRYHSDYYTSHGLFESGTWLEKPNATLIDVAQGLAGQAGVRILDLGAGVGRNAIQMAQVFAKSSVSIDCVDILPLALEKLKENALKHGVSHQINPVLSGVAEYSIISGKYDLIAAMSVLEHSVRIDEFSSLLKKIQLGTKVGGFNCLSITTDLAEINCTTKESLSPSIEAAFSAEECAKMLRESFNSWEIQKLDFSPFKQSFSRNGETIEWSANYCLFVARRRV